MQRVVRASRTLRVYLKQMSAVSPFTPHELICINLPAGCPNYGTSKLVRLFAAPVTACSLDLHSGLHTAITVRLEFSAMARVRYLKLATAVAVTLAAGPVFTCAPASAQLKWNLASAYSADNFHSQNLEAPERYATK
jgi:hypothetical protein